MEREVRTITMFGKECRIQKVADNLWDFLDLPIKSMIYNSWKEAKKYNYNLDGKDNLLEKEVLPKLKAELSKTFKNFECFIPNKPQLRVWYPEIKDRIKFWEGEPYHYWTSSPDPGYYDSWYYVDCVGNFSFSAIDFEDGVSFAFYINEINTNEAITSVENNIIDKMPEDVKEKDVPAEEYHKLEHEIEKLKALVVEQALEILELKRIK